MEKADREGTYDRQNENPDAGVTILGNKLIEIAVGVDKRYAGNGVGQLLKCREVFFFYTGNLDDGTIALWNI